MPPEIEHEVDLAPRLSFGVPCRARQVWTIRDQADLQPLLAAHRGELLPLGGATNVLPLGRLEATVLFVAWLGIDIVREVDDQVLVEVAAGESWDDLVRRTLEQGLFGLENLSAIPGSVGAAPIQNIGAYGVELEEVFESLEARRIEDGALRRFERKDCAFGYRDSVFKRAERGRWIITSVRLTLSRRPHPRATYAALAQELARRGIQHPTPHDVSAAVRAVRASKLPDPRVLGNAGSFFKNPELDPIVAEALRQRCADVPTHPTKDGRIKVPAGFLIERAGWRGRRQGAAGSHKDQALVLVNHGGATGQDVLALAHAIEADVRAQFGVTLEREVQVIGTDAAASTSQSS